jgi:PKD repeat protein
MKKLYFLLAASFSIGFVMSQTQRLVVVEEFTQASCGPCAAANPAFNALLSTNTTKVVSVKYQTSWPGVDPMNAQNATEVANRVSYYGVTGVPNAILSGNVANGSPSTVTQSNINSEYANPSSFSIDLKHWFNATNDSIYINCAITCNQAVTMTDPHLRIALIEKTISFVNAPGSNGETEFYNVMRKMYPNASGSVLSGTWTVGQTKNISFFAKVPTYIYNFNELATVAWIQDDASKNILQSGFNPIPSTPLALAPVSEFTSDIVTTCDGLVKFKDISALFPTSWSWDFGDGTTSNLKNPTHVYTNSNNYTVSLTTTNANGSNVSTIPTYVNVNLTSAAPTGNNDNICGAGVANLSASTTGIGPLNWYNTFGQLVNTGTTYTPTVSGTTLYYVREAIANTPLSTGALDNNISATGAYFTANNTHGLYFNVAKNCVLQSVKVYCNSAGNRTIVVLDANGTIVNTSTINIAAGLQTLNLNFPLNAGNGYLIKIAGTLVDLYRNAGGAVYPYATSVVTITGNTASSAPTNYYYFYDWQVLQDPCLSPATIVAALDTCSVLGLPKINLQSSLAIFPNPSKGNFSIAFNSPIVTDYQVVISNTLGKVVYKENLAQFTGTYQKQIEMNHLSKGMYILNVSNGQQKISRKIMIE